MEEAQLVSPALPDRPADGQTSTCGTFSEKGTLCGVLFWTARLGGMLGSSCLTRVLLASKLAAKRRLEARSRHTRVLSCLAQSLQDSLPVQS